MPIRTICTAFKMQWKNIYGPRNCSVSPLKSVDGTILIKDQKLITNR